MQTETHTPPILSAAERVAWAVAEVSRGFKAGEWSIREGCRLKKVHPQTYYKHRKQQGEASVSGGGPIAAAPIPGFTPIGDDGTQTAHDSTGARA